MGAIASDALRHPATEPAVERSATTLNVYAHFIDQADEDSARVMGNLLAVRAADPAPKRRGRPPEDGG